MYFKIAFGVIFLTTLLLSSTVISQDELLIRKVLTSKKFLQEQNMLNNPYKFLISSPLYKIDIDEDGRVEYLQYVKKDHENLLDIFDNKKKLLVRVEMEISGRDSSLYKILVRKISPTDKVLVLFFYEGMMEYTELYGSARIYLVNIDNKFKNIIVSKGFPYWEEYRDSRHHYHRRKYDIEFSDLDRDGVEEIMVKFENISRVIKRDDAGNWKML